LRLCSGAASFVRGEGQSHEHLEHDRGANDYQLGLNPGGDVSETVLSRAGTTALSNPTSGNRWFAATLNPSFPSATTFLGDYPNIAAIPGGNVAAYWTDLRETACFAGLCAKGQDAILRSFRKS